MKPPDSTTALWESVVSQLKEQLTLQQFSTWFRGVHADAFSTEVLELSVPNAFYRDWLRKRYAGVILGEIERATGSRPRLSFKVRNEEAPAAFEELGSSEPFPGMAAQAPAAAEHRRPPRGFDLNPSNTFDTLVSGPSNQLAMAAAQAFAEHRAGSLNPLLIQADVGMGKTHLLQAITAKIRAQNPSKRVLHVTGEHFLNSFLSAMEKKDLPGFRDRFRLVDVLVVDDAQCLAGKERTQVEFLHTFQALVNAGRQVVLSTDRDPSDIPGLSPQLQSCFRGGMMCVLEPFTPQMRRELVTRIAEREGVTIPSEVVEFVSENARRGVREIIGSTIRVLGTATLQDTIISLELARKVMGERVGAPRRRISVDQVAEVVTEHYGVRLAELQTRRRTREVVVPRQVCMAIARRLSGSSLEAIGRYFGGRDHSTVLYALDRVEKRAAKEPEFKDHLEELTRSVLQRADRPPTTRS